MDSVTSHTYGFKNGVASPGWWDSVDWVPACKPESLFGFLVRTHAWVMVQVPSSGCMRGHHTLIFLSHSFPLSLKLNKIVKIKYKKPCSQHDCPMSVGHIALATCVLAMRGKSLTAPVVNHLLSQLQNHRVDILESNERSTLQIKGTNLHDRRTFIPLMVSGKS